MPVRGKTTMEWIFRDLFQLLYDQFLHIFLNRRSLCVTRKVGYVFNTILLWHGFGLESFETRQLEPLIMICFHEYMIIPCNSNQGTKILESQFLHEYHVICI